MDKEQLRKKYREIRQGISAKRRKSAAAKAFAAVQLLAAKHRYVLSHASFNDEFETDQINLFLANEGKLVLPKMQGNSLAVFQVNDFKKQLIPNSWGILEPNPQECFEITSLVLTLALIPGLAFDASFQRLGYGKGYYDRFLTNQPCISHKYGLGFSEQLALQHLPVGTADVPLTKLLLF